MLNSQQLQTLSAVKSIVDQLTNTDNNEQDVFQYLTEHYTELEQNKFWRDVKQKLPKGLQDSDHKQVYIDSTTSYRSPIGDLHDVEIQFFTWCVCIQGCDNISQISAYLTKIFQDLRYWKVDIMNIITRAVRKFQIVKGDKMAKFAEQRENFKDFVVDEDFKSMRLFDKKGTQKGNVIDKLLANTKDVSKIEPSESNRAEARSVIKEIQQKEEKVQEKKNEEAKKEIKKREKKEKLLANTDKIIVKNQKISPEQPMQNFDSIINLQVQELIKEQNSLISQLITEVKNSSQKSAQALQEIGRALLQTTSAMEHFKLEVAQPIIKMNESLAVLVKTTPKKK